MAEFLLSSAENTKMTYFWHLNDHYSGSKHDKEANDRILSSTLWVLTVGLFHFCISRTSNSIPIGSPLYSSLENTHLHAQDYTFKTVNFWYITCIFPNLILPSPRSHDLTYLLFIYLFIYLFTYLSIYRNIVFHVTFTNIWYITYVFPNSLLPWHQSHELTRLLFIYDYWIWCQIASQNNFCFNRGKIIKTSTFIVFMLSGHSVVFLYLMLVLLTTT